MRKFTLRDIMRIREINSRRKKLGLTAFMKKRDYDNPVPRTFIHAGLVKKALIHREAEGMNPSPRVVPPHLRKYIKR